MKYRRGYVFGNFDENDVALALRHLNDVLALPKPEVGGKGLRNVSKEAGRYVTSEAFRQGLAEREA